MCGQKGGMAEMGLVIRRRPDPCRAGVQVQDMGPGSAGVTTYTRSTFCTTSFARRLAMMLLRWRAFFYFDVDEDIEEIGAAVVIFRLLICPHLGDDVGDAGQGSGFVAQAHAQAADEEFVLAAGVPGDIDPFSQAIRRNFQRVAIERVDGDAFAGGDDADDLSRGWVQQPA